MINATKEDNMSGTRRADLSKGIACESPTGVTGVDTRSSPGTGQRPSIEEQMRFDQHVCSCPHRLRSRKSAKRCRRVPPLACRATDVLEEMTGLNPLWERASFPTPHSKLENAASPTISLVGSLAGRQRSGQDGNKLPDGQDAMPRGLVNG
ncbi:MAG: hypothetical protein EOS76_01465 [Mesorhizobium sp.]|uniref:hypothetical protein n=1 Tax=unclassified Mesorhizobium TaxID=325217 RepID=UPI000F755210|nr:MULTISPECIES: hypothetical protein [unclassified Mesorhizobium]AZO34193.1 hypothetical protein EJ072_06715 [Mesorhizobium sp. M2A.F.Ca.ET.046.03.2.1]AZO71624.1 hypothetical protein EJ067_11095 [Mesorhizobium sp. M1D.F.Ca.ET.043.01.1.1]RWB49798.1 MAG: hypothetical protein EOQ44_01375 [Mesorhizobium sp.]RWE22494.1 MAG: hypothetical protein EOS76_01465 [Mesorhizobium sp.]